MANDTSRINNHPGFMPLNRGNIKSNTSDTQSARDKVEREKDVRHDEGLADNSKAGGEKGRA